MADVCACIMVDVLKRMQNDIEKVEASNSKTVEAMYEYKENTALVKQVVDQVLKAQDLQTITAEKNQMAMFMSIKEIKDTQFAGFKSLADQRISDQEKEEERKVATALEQKIIDKEKKDDAKDMIKEKRKFRWAVYLAVLLLFVNTVYGFFVKYAPTLVGLPMTK